MSEQIHSPDLVEGTAAASHGGPRIPERAVKPLPAKAILWVPSKLQSQPPASHTFDVLVAQSVLKALEAHVEQMADGGAAGLLVGAVFECPDSGRPWVQVSGTRPFTEPLGEEAEVGEFGAIAVPLIQRTESAGERVVGWYHGHTSLGVYLSEQESAIHNAHFPEMWQLGLIVLSPGRAGGIFLRAPDGALSRSGYWPFYEQLHESSYLADGNLRTFVDWQNHLTDVPVSRVGEDGVTSSLTPDTTTVSRKASLAGETTPIHRLQRKPTTPPGRPSEGPFQQRVDYAPAPKSEVQSGLAHGGPLGESEEEYFTHQLKRKLSAVDTTLSALGPPGPPPSETTVQSEGTGGLEERTENPTPDLSALKPVEVARPTAVKAAPAEPASRLSPQRVRLSPRWLLLVLALATATVVGLIWLTNRGSAGQPDDGVAEETPADLSVSENQPASVAAVGSIPGSRPPEATTAAPAITDPPVTTPFARALEIFQQEIEGYRKHQDEFARGLIGCNILNSRYRSVDEAFVRLATVLAEARESPADALTLQFNTAGVSMDEVDQHFDVSSCPRPQ